MEILVNVVGDLEHYPYKSEKNEFIKEFSEGYLELELIEEEKQLNDYLKAYREIENKNSYNAQYLKILINNLQSKMR